MVFRVWTGGFVRSFALESVLGAQSLISDSFPRNAVHAQGTLGCLPEHLSLLRWNPGVCCQSHNFQHQTSTEVVLCIVLQQIEDIVPHLIKQDRSETFRAAVARMKASSGAGSRPSQTGPTASKVGVRARRSWGDTCCASNCYQYFCHQCTVTQGSSQENHGQWTCQLNNKLRTGWA